MQSRFLRQNVGTCTRMPAVGQITHLAEAQALALADKLGIRPLLAHCHYGLGILYTQGGRPEQARAELSVAIGLYRTMEMTFWLERAEAVEMSGVPP